MAIDNDCAFFRGDGDWFVGNGVSRGPWSADACHAGPVTGLMARAAEQIVTDKQLSRLTVNLHRPVPIAGFRVTAEVQRDGRAVTTTAVTLRDSGDRVCAIASSLHIATHSFAALPTSSVPRPIFDEATPGRFPVKRGKHDLPFFGQAVEVAYPPGETGEPGPTTLWMRTLPILEGEDPSPFQSLCPLADSGNGISRNSDFSEASFVNPDLTVLAYRLPESRWLASKSISFWQPSGIGMAHATLYDKLGALGTALQTLVVTPVV